MKTNPKKQPVTQKTTPAPVRPKVAQMHDFTGPKPVMRPLNAYERAMFKESFKSGLRKYLSHRLRQANPGYDDIIEELVLELIPKTVEGSWEGPDDHKKPHIK